MKNWNQQRVSLQKIFDEYKADPLKDDDRMYRLKQIIEELDDLDRSLLIVYADEESMAKAGKMFCVSPATIWNRMTKIRKIIKEKLDE